MSHRTWFLLSPIPQAIMPLISVKAERGRKRLGSSESRGVRRRRAGCEHRVGQERSSDSASIHEFDDSLGSNNPAEERSGIDLFNRGVRGVRCHRLLHQIFEEGFRLAKIPRPTIFPLQPVLQLYLIFPHQELRCPRDRRVAHGVALITRHSHIVATTFNKAGMRRMHHQTMLALLVWFFPRSAACLWG